MFDVDAVPLTDIYFLIIKTICFEMWLKSPSQSEWYIGGGDDYRVNKEEVKRLI